METQETTRLAGIIKRDLDLPSAYQQIEPLLQKGEKQAAIVHLLSLAEQFPHSARIQNDLGVLYYQSGDSDKALSCYRKAVDLDPENIIYQKNLADFYWLEKGDIEGALTIYNEVLARHPEDLETLQALGHICLSLGKYEDGAFFFNRILDIEPWNTAAWKALEALSAGEPQTHRSEEEETAALFDQVQSRLEEGETEEAVRILEAIRRRHPEHALAFNDLGVLYYRLGNKAKALYYYQKAVQLSPQEGSFKKNLADFYLVEMDEIEEALKLYLEVLQNNSEDVETLFAIGHVCIRLGRLEDAAVFL